MENQQIIIKLVGYYMTTNRCHFKEGMLSLKISIPLVDGTCSIES